MANNVPKTKALLNLVLFAGIAKPSQKMGNILLFINIIIIG